MSFVFTADEMNGLDDNQKNAIIDNVIAGVLADGTVSDAEVSKFDSEFRKVPRGVPEAEMETRIKASLEKISGFSDPQQAVNLVKETAETLKDTNVREKTFAICAVFEISMERVKLIADAVKQDS